MFSFHIFFPICVLLVCVCVCVRMCVCVYVCVYVCQATRGSGHAQNRDGEAVVFVAAVAVAGSASLLHSVTSTIYHATDLGTPRLL